MVYVVRPTNVLKMFARKFAYFYRFHYELIFYEPSGCLLVEVMKAVIAANDRETETMQFVIYDVEIKRRNYSSR